MKTDRLFQIIYILLEKKCVTASELSEMLSVSVRTVYRDVEALSIAGIPIYCIAGNGGGISLMPGFKIEKALLSDEEWKQILFALQSMKISDENVEKLLAKIRGVSGKKEKKWMEVDFSRWGHQKEDMDKFTLLKQAIIQSKVVEIQYYDAQGKQSCRRLKPARLVFRNGNWYLYGYCMLADDYRCFKISRIASITETGEIFEDEFNDISQMEISQQDSNVSISLRIDAKEAYRVYDDFREEDIERQEDGSVLLRASVPLDKWFCTYILSFGRHINVLEPIWLKKEMKKYVKKLAEFYEI